jgi:3-oxoacyl-[acyl-carrier protein] reductase
MTDIIAIHWTNDEKGALMVTRLSRSRGDFIMSNASTRTAIVTGSSRGIGAAVARRLAKDGLSVVVNYTGDAAEAESLVGDIKKDGGNALSIQADVSDPAAMRRMFDQAATVSEGVDVLVNNAGIMQLANISDADDGLFDRHVSINLKGVFNGMREAAKRMRNGGRIISLSSSVVGLYQPTYGIYAATKAGVEALTHVLANELRGRNITVNAVAPGPIATNLFLKGKSKELIDHLAKLAPLERMGEPEDIAAVVAFLAGPDGGWMNGQVLRPNGGRI